MTNLKLLGQKPSCFQIYIVDSIAYSMNNTVGEISIGGGTCRIAPKLQVELSCNMMRNKYMTKYTKSPKS